MSCCEDRRDGAQTEAFHRVEGEPLRRKAERDTVIANRFGALGQNRSESLRGPAENTDGGVEFVREPGGR